MSRLRRIAPAIGLVPALLGTSLPVQAQQVGINSAVNPDASGTPPGANTRKLVIGQQVVHDEQIKTGVGGQAQILFLDESAMTVGPNSDVAIDNFVYDPNTGKGQLAMSATAGVLRFVGGKLSKNEDAVSLHTPTATIGVRGGIFIASVSRDGPTQVTFLYGQGLPSQPPTRRKPSRARDFRSPSPPEARRHRLLPRHRPTLFPRRWTNSAGRAAQAAARQTRRPTRPSPEAASRLSCRGISPRAFSRRRKTAKASRQRQQQRSR